MNTADKLLEIVQRGFGVKGQKYNADHISMTAELSNDIGEAITLKFPNVKALANEDNAFMVVTVSDEADIEPLRRRSFVDAMPPPGRTFLVVVAELKPDDNDAVLYVHVPQS